MEKEKEWRRPKGGTVIERMTSSGSWVTMACCKDAGWADIICNTLNAANQEKGA